MLLRNSDKFKEVHGMEYKLGSDIAEYLSTLFQKNPEANLQLADPSLVQYYHDLKNRIIWIDEEIDGMTLDVVSKIIRWNQDDKDIPVEDRKPIRILFNSPGGSLDVEETIVSIIKLSKTPIYGIALGMVASAASLIFLSCHKRFALSNAYLILHKGSCQNISGDYTNVQNAMEDYRKQIEQLEKFYIENTQIPEEIVREKLKSDWYIRGQKLIEYGLIDEWIEDIEIFL